MSDVFISYFQRMPEPTEALALELTTTRLCAVVRHLAAAQRVVLARDHEADHRRQGGDRDLDAAVVRRAGRARNSQCAHLPSPCKEPTQPMQLRIYLCALLCEPAPHGEDIREDLTCSCPTS